MFMVYDRGEYLAECYSLKSAKLIAGWVNATAYAVILL